MKKETMEVYARTVVQIIGALTWLVGLVITILAIMQLTSTTQCHPVNLQSSIRLDIILEFAVGLMLVTIGAWWNGRGTSK